MSVTDREPIRAPEHDETPRMGGEALLAEAAAAIPAARARLDAMMTDLFLPDAGRLSDFHRATMTRLLARLIERIERAIRGHLAAAGPPPLDGMPGVDDAPVAAPRLARAGVLRDDELTALLLRRAEEQRLGRLLASHTARDRLPPVRLVDELPDPLAAAMVDFLAVAARRHDAFHDLA
ncbi:MAG TPA: hypothetical protein VNQ31_08890, partial [Sphingomonadaceae bacterium]|nr:hypothetical protein [Sphingomonadaceae bacterium]